MNTIKQEFIPLSTDMLLSFVPALQDGKIDTQLINQVYSSYNCFSAAADDEDEDDEEDEDEDDEDEDDDYDEDEDDEDDEDGDDEEDEDEDED